MIGNPFVYSIHNTLLANELVKRGVLMLVTNEGDEIMESNLSLQNLPLMFLGIHIK